ncbi:MAG: twin-arginine translocase subunit TatC [Candidatus Dormibacteraeota bacterium]|nr:twin-arginine translocase subunit TatC [Candidatus Dormibacteraeota bacterium]
MSAVALPLRPGRGAPAKRADLLIWLVATRRLTGWGWGRQSHWVSDGDPPQSTLVEHLEDLRRAIIVSLIAWGLATAVAFVFNQRLIAVLERPLQLALLHTHSPFGQRVVVTSPIAGLAIPFEVAGVAGVILALPVITWELWRFVAPGLHRNERRLAFPFVFGTLFFFALGGLFAYFVLPIGLTFLATFLGGNAVYLPDLGAYLSFLALVVLVFGVTFEMPVVLCLLGAMGILSSQHLRNWRKPAYFVIILVALVVTPGADPFTPTFLSLALILFYEGSILFIRGPLHH